MNFKSLPQLLDYFKEESTCIKYYENLRWNGRPVCPHCESENPYVLKAGYKCSNSDCHKKFNVKIGTIFENSKVSFRIWFAAIYLCTSHKKGISSVQLAVDLNVTQKTAWFMLHRIREMLADKAPEMLGNSSGLVEADETYVGGKEGNRHKSKKLASPESGLANDGTVYNKKKVVLGIIERDGKVILKHVPAATSANMVPILKNFVVKGSKIVTDESVVYHKLPSDFSHETVNHSLKIYAIGDTHTNTIENFWSVLKRGIYGIYHQVSDKHLERYLNEFSARFNNRKNDPYDNFNRFLAKSDGGLLYKNLIAKK